MFLPKPYPDELIGSVLARGSVHTGLPPKVLNRLVLGRPHGQVSFFLPSGLPTIARLAHMDSEELALRHTVLPYVTAFMPLRQAVTMRSKVLRPSIDEPGSLASLIKSVTQGTRVLRACTLCVRDDMAQFGESYWHRSHLIPGVYLCPVHGSPLVEATEILTARPVTAGRAANMTELHTSVPCSLPGRTLLCELARISLAPLAEGWQHRDDWCETYRSLALARGYNVPGGAVAGAQLALDLISTFGRAFVSALGALHVGSATVTWPSLMVRRSSTVPFSPVKHSLLSAYLACCKEEPRLLTYQPPGKKPADAASRDEACARGLKASWRALARDGGRLTVQAMLEAEGAWASFRHNRTLFPKTEALLQEFKRSEQAERQMGRRPCWRKRLGFEP